MNSSDELDENRNGLYLNGKAIPLEIISSILKWVDEDSLVFSCRLVCKEWREIIDELVWEEKCNCTKLLLGQRSEKQIPWWVTYWVIKKRTFRENLIKNNCGQEEINYWNILENYGDGWIVEEEPVGVMDDLPQCDEVGTNKTCFVTSFHWCSKNQVVKLSEVGLSDKIMDEIQPDFVCSDWIATRFDCGGIFVLYCSLLDSALKPIGNQFAQEIMLEGGSPWTKVSGNITGPYPKGARYICFFHKGKDTQFWKGHYGIKITGSFLNSVFPKERFLSEDPTCVNSEEAKCLSSEGASDVETN